MAKVMYQGLHRRETYDEILGYLERGGGAGVDIALPNRQASFIRSSPQYQNILTLDFVDLQNQQENLLKQQQRDIIVKAQSSNSSSMKSVLSSSTPAKSVATEQLNSDFSSLDDADVSQQQHYDSMDDYHRDMDKAEDEKKQRMAERGKKGMVAHVDAVTKLAESYAAAKATGTEDYTGATGSKFLEKIIAEGQRQDV